MGEVKGCKKKEKIFCTKFIHCASPSPTPYLSPCFGAGYIGSPQCVWTESESVITVYDVCLQWEWRMILTICPFPFHFGFVELLFLQKKLKSVLYHVFYFGLFWMMRVSVSIVDRHSA